MGKTPFRALGFPVGTGGGGIIWLRSTGEGVEVDETDRLDCICRCSIAGGGRPAFIAAGGIDASG